MRLAEDKIKQAILHPEKGIRDATIRYFSEGTNADTAVMSLAIEAMERYGRTKAFAFTHHLKDLPQSEQTIQWVIAELQGEFAGEAVDRYSHFLNLSRLLCRADVRLVVRHAAEAFQAAGFDAKERLAFRERLHLYGWDAETCWKALLRHCEENKDKNDIEEFDPGHGERIVEALARLPHDYQGQILEILSQDVRDYRRSVHKWLQPLTAELAGEMRLQAAIPLLVKNLGHPYSFLADQSMFALAKIGTEEVVAAVSDRFPGADREYRSYASELLGKIHLDVTVERILGLLPAETELHIRTNLCAGLLNHFSFEGVEATRQVLRRYKLTPDLGNLRSELVAVSTLMEVPFPELEEWSMEARKDAQDLDNKVKEMHRMMYEAGGDLGALIEKMKAKQPKEKPAPRSALFQPPLQREEGWGATWPGEKPVRVGRNDPCPCGSGKKFKNCCLRR